MTGNSGYFDLTSGFFTVRTYWSETYEVDTNASIVRIDSVHIKTSYMGTDYPSGAIRVDGQTVVTFDSFAGTHSVYVGAVNTFAAVGGSPAAPWKSGTITHDANGEKSIAIAVNFSGSMGGGWSVSGSQTVALTSIPRASTPTLSAANPKAGETVTIYTNRRSTAYTHDISYIVGGEEKSIGRSVEESVAWDIPITLAGEFTGKSGNLIIRTVTKSGGTAIGTVDIPVTITIPENAQTKPVISMVTTAPVHSLGSAFQGVYVQGRSAVKVTVSAASSYSGLSEPLVTVNGKNYTGYSVTTEILNKTGPVEIKVTVTDKRGFSNETVLSVTYYAYSLPCVIPARGQNQILCLRCNADGTPDLSGTYLKIAAARKYSSVKGINKCILRYRYGVAGGSIGEWKTLLAMTDGADTYSGVVSGVTLSETTAYTVQIGAYDDIGMSSENADFHIATKAAVWHAADGGKGLGIGGYSQRDGVDMFWDMYMNSNRITELPEPAANSDAVPKSYVDAAKTSAISTAKSNVRAYGLGGACADPGSYDANKAVNTGFYNCDVNTPDNRWWFIDVKRHRDGSYITQRAYQLFDIFSAVRISRDGGSSWTKWYWYNPPLQPWVEYATTECIEGLAVYVKNVPLGTLPNASSKYVGHGASVGACIRVHGLISNGRSIPDNQISDFFVGSDNIVITTKSDMSSYTGTAIMYYLK